MKLYRIILPVNDIEDVTKFYSYILEKKGERVSPGRHYFSLDGVILACYDPIADGDDVGDGWRFHNNQYIYIAVENLEAIHDRVKSMGAKNIGLIDNMPWGERLFYANDPFDNPICFVDNNTLFVKG